MYNVKNILYFANHVVLLRKQDDFWFYDSEERWFLKFELCGSEILGWWFGIKTIMKHILRGKKEQFCTFYWFQKENFIFQKIASNLQFCYSVGTLFYLL